MKDSSEQKQRVYISSTSIDLIEYRQAIFKAIDTIGVFTEDMILWPEEYPANDEKNVNLSERLAQVQKGDFFILILAHRCGPIPPGATCGIPELEYQAAREKGILTFAFFVDESIPWPPKDVEWERREQIKQFKEKVKGEARCQQFRSSHELATLVTQSLVLFLTRHQKKQRKEHLFTVSPQPVDLSIHLKAKPDVILQIGHAEDDLPLLLQIKRTQGVDLPSQLHQLTINYPFVKSIKAYYDLLEAVEKHATEVLIKARILPVRMNDGRTEEMYISSRNLSKLFHSTFSYIIERAEGQTIPAGKSKEEPNTVKSIEEESEYHLFAQSMTTSFPPPFPDSAGGDTHKLQSVGGRNRFLGISLITGLTYSVGQKANQWVEWRPFVYESIPANFPGCRFHIKTRRYPLFECHAGEYHQRLLEYAAANTDPDKKISVDISFRLTRKDLGKCILNIATTVLKFHHQGKVHGDIKPGNIVLSCQGPILIDEFEIKEGDLAPGWTPVWSAPEQILKEPVSFKSDVYPLGRMLVKILEGQLVGEVRKFRIPPLPNGSDEIDIFYNPYVY